MQTKQIDTYTVTVAPLPAFQALEHLTTLTTLVGPPVLGLFGGESDKLAVALAASLRGIKPAEVTALLRGLLATTIIQKAGGVQTQILPVFDLEFQGKLLTALKIAAFAIEVHYADFFDVARKGLGGLGERMKAKLAETVAPSA
jgi:hypothetical protein